jgi:asparagine synthase (glutamine-hydrolysing)
MCGIAGEVSWDGSPTVEPSRLLATVRHRGPDAEGAFARDGAWVGQTRLSIIDVPGGDPPITDEAGAIGVALNGEIYNFRALRTDLQERGHTLATHGDTEVVAHLAEELDPVALAARLDGMFALAVWDAPRRRLVLVRDRLGKKPLHYWHDGRRLVFGSELKTVLAHPAVPRRVRSDAIPDYLTFGYVPTPDTFYEGVRSVPPGHVLVAEAGGAPRVEPYWELRLPGAGGAPRLDVSLDEAAAVVRGALRTAVQRRLVADVPLGAFLSGGIDSSAVVALMAEAGHGRVSSFTIGFEDDSGFDERPYARAVAERYDTEHTEFVVRPDAAELIERLVWHHDQPFGDSSALPTFLLSELTSQHVKVALCGDGGDELFGGYERFAAALALARYQVVPRPLRTVLGRAARAAGPIASRAPALAKARRAMLRTDRGPEEGLLAWVSYVPEERRAALLGSADGPGAAAYRRLWAATAGAHPLDRLLDLNIRTYLLDDLLPKVDRMSMAHALEVRAPFLDHELAELAFRLPPSTRVRGFTLKRVLKAAVADLLPGELLDRPKQGFGIPLDRWFREDLAGMVDATLGAQDSRVGAHVSRDALRAMLADHRAGRENLGHALWTLLTLELWLRREAAEA